ncbi:ribose-5-phosphate isomerase [Brevipalpus obovatus]|uniref:ribose-5-phosphate isomerase n=1 Tax=Brevipalpus obovatus TaxID=246614 RepID=UPI003D9EDEE5
MSKDHSVTLEEAKKLAAYHAADQMFKTESNLSTIGIGSGSTVIYAVERIADHVKSNKLWNIKFVPTSFQAKQLIVDHNLPLTELEIDYNLDCTIDGADEVDADKFCIKGGGGCLTQEKIVASCSKRLMIVCDYTKVSHHLGEKWIKGIPIEVIPLAWVPIKNRIEKNFGGQAILRMAMKKAGPVVTDNGNFILDWKFDPTVARNWHETNTALTMIPGVVESGLFLDMASDVYFCSENGEVREL